MKVETILERIGLGPTHTWMMVTLSLVEVINGYKIVMISLISPHLKDEWGLDEEVKNIPLAFYFGIIAGSLLAGSLANFSGRKSTLFFGQVIQTIASLIMVYCNRFSIFVMSLIIAGLGFGATLIIANTLLSEMMPQKYRGKSLLFISFIAIAGKFFAILSAYCFGMHNWRKPQSVLCFVSLALSVIIFVKIPESFRVLLLKGEIAESEEILNRLLKQQKKASITKQQKKILKEDCSQNLHDRKNKSSLQQIFSKKARRTTILLSVNWFAINFMFYGQLFIMPFIFEQKNSGAFTQFAQMIMGELPSIVLTFNMIERQKLGRKYSIVIFFTAAALLNLGLVYVESVVMIALSRLAMKSVLQILYPFTTESYSTPMRSSGLAFCTGVGRLGSIIMPMIVYPLYQINPYLVFLSFLAVSVLGILSAVFSHETLHHSLDSADFDTQHQQFSILSYEGWQQSPHHDTSHKH